MPKPQRKKRTQTSTKIDMKSNARRVITIPELLALVAHELDIKERRKLMSVSKHFFQSVGPIVWRSVPRLDVVVRLIKGAKIEVKHSWAPYKYQFMTRFPPRLNLRVSSKRSLDRYDLYAPWIQELEIYGGYYQEVINPGWLLALLDGRPALPNLRRLTANTSAPIGEEDLMGFFDMFISPYLTEIRTIIPNEGLPMITSSRVPASLVPEFLEKLRKSCPQIRVLELYPENAHASSWSERYIPSDQSRGTLSSFTNLRSFSSTTYVLEPAILAVIGGLPYLESLGVRGATTELPVLDKQLSIPKTWFPVLKDLRLYDLEPRDIEVLWSQPTIVKKLTSVLIQADDSTRRYKDDDPLQGRNWVGPFLEALPRLSPHLKDVAFFIGSLDNRIEIQQDHWERFRVDEHLFYVIMAYRSVMFARSFTSHSVHP